MPAALVTGASKGIGAAIARRLAKDGFDVVVHYNSDLAGAKATAAAVKRLGRKAVLVHADLAEKEGAHVLAQAAAGAFPALDCVVHNAGFYDRRGFDELDESAWRSTLIVDLEAPALLTRALRKRLAKGASVVFITSIVAARGSTHGTAYATAKAGLVGLARTLAQELAPKVRVNAVAPGYIDTQMLAGDSAQKRRQRVQEVPLKRLGQPEDIANAVSFLAGPDSSYVTGTVLHVNGGAWIG